MAWRGASACRAAAQPAVNSMDRRPDLSQRAAAGVAAQHVDCNRAGLWPGDPGLALYADLFQRPGQWVWSVWRALRHFVLSADGAQALPAGGQPGLGHCLSGARGEPGDAADLSGGASRRCAGCAAIGGSTGGSAAARAGWHHAQPAGRSLATAGYLSDPGGAGRAGVIVVELGALRQHMGQRLCRDRTL